MGKIKKTKQGNQYKKSGVQPTGVPVKQDRKQ